MYPGKRSHLGPPAPGMEGLARPDSAPLLVLGGCQSPWVSREVTGSCANTRREDVPVAGDLRSGHGGHVLSHPPPWDMGWR